MNRLLALSIALAALATTAPANLVLNGDFDEGSAHWSWSGSGGTYFYTSGTDTICSQGWWNGISIWQDTTALVEANTLYTLSIRARNGDGTGRGVTINLQDVSDGWKDIVGDTSFLFPDEDKGVQEGPWREFSIQFDSSANPGLVGHSIGVGARLYEDTSWDPNGWGWVHYDRLTLTAQAVPEPVTMLSLGLGALALVARRRR